MGGGGGGRGRGVGGNWRTHVHVESDTAYNKKMLQHWVNEGEFYVGGFVLLKFIELVTFVRCAFIFALHIRRISHWADI